MPVASFHFVFPVIMIKYNKPLRKCWRTQKQIINGMIARPRTPSSAAAVAIAAVNRCQLNVPDLVFGLFCKAVSISPIQLRKSVFMWLCVAVWPINFCFFF